ncbi:MAG: isoprenylcysteine carboxyl methyltransferase [Betaproteobacteria bacterium HGW-Betaproteobacteria-12]|nr:MAG: isoprenylcysteine carboxyl methyltransferase [Betaproteobacteria bacterium HGW-Betaproteobacteria-12]
MPEIIALTLGTAANLWLSRRALRAPGGHGFYRFFAWEAILGLLVLNHEPWGQDPYSPHQLVSWLLMLLSIALVYLGASQLVRRGSAAPERGDETLYAFEKTTRLVTNGIYAYIRHPMYASLLALAWAAYLQDPNLTGTLIAAFATLSLQLTAMADEKECLAYFGAEYANYMRRTRRFIPWLL